MAKSGSIIIIDDDLDDQEILTAAADELGVSNKLLFFTRCQPAFEYLQTTEEQPFLILCDINMPLMTGIEFKKQIDNDKRLRKKSIPFIFFSTSTDKATVEEAFIELTVQGFFKKSYNVSELKKTITIILEYWQLCKHPNAE